MSGNFRQVTGNFWISSQITLDDVERVAGLGIRAIVNNRPDGEAPAQPAGAEIEQAAVASGLAYRAVPIDGRPGPERGAAMAEALAGIEGPVLAYCGSGARSMMAWALAQTAAGHDRDETLLAARNAGYDLTGLI